MTGLKFRIIYFFESVFVRCALTVYQIRRYFRTAPPRSFWDL